MNQQPCLIICPVCKRSQDENTLGSNKHEAITLGSITSEGYVIIKRNVGRMTMIMATTYSLICDCGYFIRVNNGRMVASSDLPGTFINGQ